MKDIAEKIVLNQKNAEYLLGKGLATKNKMYMGKITKLLSDGLILDNGAYILYKCCLNNYEIVKPKEE